MLFGHTYGEWAAVAAVQGYLVLFGALGWWDSSRRERRALRARINAYTIERG